jgi:hypothetical protein
MAEPAKAGVPTGMITGLFADRESAEQAYRCVSKLGYGADDISVVMSEQTRAREFAHSADTALSDKTWQAPDAQSKAAKELGGPAGGTLGTAAPALAAIGTLLLIPGINIAVAGPIAVALTAAGAVGIAGGIIGALADWRVPHSHAEEYEKGIRKGGILLGCKTRSREDAEQIKQCWHQNGGRSIHS